MLLYHTLGQYYEMDQRHELSMAGVFVGGIVIIIVAILAYRLISASSQRAHQLKDADLKIRRDALMAELREQTACRCPRCGTQMELIRKDAPVKPETTKAQA